MAKPATRNRVTELIEEHGRPAIITWFSIFGVSLVAFYALLSVGVDLDPIIAKVVGLWGGDVEAWKGSTAGTGKVVLAYAATKLIQPLRIALFLVLTPIVVRFTRKAPAVSPEAEDAPEAEASQP